MYIRRCPDDLVFVPTVRRCEFRSEVESCFTSAGSKHGK